MNRLNPLLSPRLRQISLRLSFLLLLYPATAGAQHVDLKVDAAYKPGPYPLYRISGDRNGDHWHLTTRSLSDGRLIQEGDFLDSLHQLPDGIVTEFHNKGSRARVHSYRAGKLQGTSLYYSESGARIDSIWFEGGRQRGISLGWYANGTRSDSTFRAADGSGAYYAWHENGKLRIEGRYANDSTETGSWKYYFENGQLQAEVDYKNGKEGSCRCWNEQGQEKPAAECAERDAEFPGGMKGWVAYMQQNLRAPSRAKPGTYTVRIRFVVDKEGNLSQFDPLTNWGPGFESEVIRLLQASPRWTPARQHGRLVKAYRTQPVTFAISE